MSQVNTSQANQNSCDSKNCCDKDAMPPLGATERWAFVWFISVLFIGYILTSALSWTDNYNYLSNGEFFDYSAYKSNKIAAVNIKTDSVDPRSHGDLASAKQNLK